MGASRIVLGRPRTAAVGLAGVAYAVLASFTHPFTWGADVVTAAPLVVAVTIALRSTRRRDRSDAGSAGAATGSTRGSRGALWLLPILAAVGWELYCYASLPRSAHPTFSSLLDIVDATRGGKIACFAAWLVLGWWLVTS